MFLPVIHRFSLLFAGRLAWAKRFADANEKDGNLNVTFHAMGAENGLAIRCRPDLSSLPHPLLEKVPSLNCTKAAAPNCACLQK